MYQYNPGYFGRTIRSIESVDERGVKHTLPKRSLVEILSVSDVVFPGDTGVKQIYHIEERSETYGRGDWALSYKGVLDGLLTDVHKGPNTRWNYEDSQAALRQGWDIWYRDSLNADGEQFELQAWAEDGRFRWDEDAWVFVWKGRESDPIARRALAFLKEHAPKEYERIRDHCKDDSS